MLHKHVESRGSLHISSTYLVRMLAFMWMCLYTYLLVHTCREVSECVACTWGVNALAPSRHLRGARVGWQHMCVRKGVNWAVMVLEGYDCMKLQDRIRFTKHLGALCFILQLNSCPASYFFISLQSLLFVPLQAFKPLKWNVMLLLFSLSLLCVCTHTIPILCWYYNKSSSLCR